MADVPGLRAPRRRRSRAGLSGRWPGRAQFLPGTYHAIIAVPSPPAQTMVTPKKPKPQQTIANFGRRQQLKLLSAFRASQGAAVAGSLAGDGA